MKIAFKAKIIADVSNDPRTERYEVNEPTIDWVRTLISQNKCSIELVPSWDSSGEPAIIITELTRKRG